MPDKYGRLYTKERVFFAEDRIRTIPSQNLEYAIRSAKRMGIKSDRIMELINERKQS